ncbi:MAG: nucleotide exchange factor GrpE [Vicinamibacteria bacterium]|nr:nucleotide exchange factor GrpE [Vicinamibacteria bacterium]
MAVEDPPNSAPQPGEAAPAAAEMQALLEETETRARLAEAKLEQAMAGYHALRAENEALRAQIGDLHEKHRSATQDIGASLARQKRAAARELQNERETIYARYIEILDNFDRAFDTVEARAASHSLMEGFILVRNQVVQVLKDGGFDRVRTLGLPYDPNTSEAIQIEDVDDPTQDGLVIRELVRGYRLDEHIVRAARVVVGRCVAPPKEDSGETVRIPGDTGETLRVSEEKLEEARPEEEDQAENG